MSTPLFGNNISPSCSYCEKTLRILTNNNQALCEKYGVVSLTHHCRHFVYDPLWRVPPRPPTMQTFTEDDFKID